MSPVMELQEAAQRAAERAGQAVVGIGVRGPVGSGVVFAPDLVLTNAHNLRGERITVTFGDGRSQQAEVSGVDVDGDLAVVRVPTAGAEPIEWADDAPPGIGSAVFALANPGGRGLRLSFGLVSSTGRAFRGPRGRRIPGGFEHTAPLPRGSSGGPVVDDQGRLVGLNTSRLAEGFYLALPADAQLRRRAEELALGRSPVRPRLGVGLAPSGVARRLRQAVGLPEADGVLVRLVEEGSPADRAGVRTGDLIVAAAGRPLTAIDELHEALDAATAAGQLEVAVLRGVEELTLTVALASEAGAQP